eukprot:9492241-Pyramimonas_sp.AAC.1
MPLVYTSVPGRMPTVMFPSSEQRMDFYIGFSPLGFGIQHRPRGIQSISGTPPPRALAIGICACSVA